jgi:branched-chain amino acid aminotransferase
MLFYEDHMVRLHQSVAAKEDFAFDSERIYVDSMRLIKESMPTIAEGNIRIVLTQNNTLIHLVDVEYPSAEMNRRGIATSSIVWERFEPQVKVFRGDYKKAVARAFQEDTGFGKPYEVLLKDGNGRITEGSRSNFFCLHNGTVYSPPESQILIGITRKYVMSSLEQAGLKYIEKAFTLDELVSMRDEYSDEPGSFAVFVTSSPFDILPVRSIDQAIFQSATCPPLGLVSKIYQSTIEYYIQSRKI